jgi:predicted P-loop ATPase
LKRPQERATWHEYLKKWLIAAVGCATNSAINNQTCLTLVGPQGYYKSTWLNRLVPDRLSGYLHVGTIDPDNKDTMIHLSQCFLINLDELETLNKSELGSLKSIMTMGENRIRRPYAHFADQLIRRASFVGSINKDSFLADETGSRRFLVFEVDTINANHGIDMDKIHAQAYYLFKFGFRYWFDRDETATVNKRNKEFAIQTTEDELVAKYCVAGSATEWKTATDIAQRMSSEYSYPLKTSSARDFGYALRKAEFPTKKVGGIAYYSVAIDRPLLNYPTLGGVKGGVGGGVTEGKGVESDLY